MENRISISNVRALREKFEHQVENRLVSDLGKSGSQMKLTKEFSSLHLNDSINSKQEVSRPLTPTKLRLSIQIPLPPSVLPTQVFKPRPFSYSEATESGSGHELLNPYMTCPPEKPPRTFLYDLLSDPVPPSLSQRPQLSPYPEASKRKPPLTASLSLPPSSTVQDDETENSTDEHEGNQSVPAHRKAIYISDMSPALIRRKKKSKVVRSVLTASSNFQRGKDCENCTSRAGLYEVPPSSSTETYLSAVTKMKQNQGKPPPSLHRISLANIRPIHVCNGNGSLPFEHNIIPPRMPPSPPPRLLRAKTEPDIAVYAFKHPSKSIATLCSSDYGSKQEKSSRRQEVNMLDSPLQKIQNHHFYQNELTSRFNAYYYPNGFVFGLDGKVNRQPLPPDHPNNCSIGYLQTYHQFFGSQDVRNGNYNQHSMSDVEKYTDFIRRHHPELLENVQPALFYRQGTSITVVPPRQQGYYLSKTWDLYQNYVHDYEYGTTEALLAPPQFRSLEATAGIGKSKSEWNLYEASHGRQCADNYVTHHQGRNSIGYNDPLAKEHTRRNSSNQNFVSTKAMFSEGNQFFYNPNNSNNNGFRPMKTIHQSIHSLVNQIYPVVSIGGVPGKDATSSTDSGIQLGAESLSSSDTPLGDSTTDTGDSDCENETDNMGTSRQVVEERKGYVRRVSSIRTTELLPFQRLLSNHLYPEPPLDHGNMRRQGALFDNLLIIGIQRDERTGAYHPIIKYKFPHSVGLPDGIERFCFPDSLEWPCHEGSTAQFYTLTITRSDGSRKYGCCYRILPDGANICIPIAYCIISQTRAIGFFRNVLQILASRHGYSESQMSFMINDLYEESLPDPGKNLLIQDPISSLPTNSIDYGMGIPLIIRRKPDGRLENTDLFVLLNSLDLSIVLKLFGSLLLERKIILLSIHLNLLSLCTEAMESMLYPFSWQHTFVPILPLNMNELLEVPAPFVIGVLRSQVYPWDNNLDEGIVVDLDQRKILSCVGDEGSILPKRLYKKLREALHSVHILFEQTESTKNVLISECFIRMFVETLGHYRKNGIFEFSTFNRNEDERDRRQVRIFKKDLFLKHVSSKSNRDFLEWFVETSMFQQFIEIRKNSDFKPGLFEQRCMEQLELNKESSFHSVGHSHWKNSNILAKGTAWFKGAFSKERE